MTAIEALRKQIIAVAAHAAFCDDRDDYDAGTAILAAFYERPDPLDAAIPSLALLDALDRLAEGVDEMQDQFPSDLRIRAVAEMVRAVFVALEADR